MSSISSAVQLSRSPANPPSLPFEIRAHARYNPAASSRLNIVPGLVGTILTMTMLIFTALSVTREIERGTMESLLSMPIKPVEVMLGKIVPDEHIHEHATCFNLKDRGLIVISSCGHVGIVNSARQAMEVSGVNKIHALVGGFHLGPAPADYLGKVIAEVKTLNPDVIIPMHCSGDNFIRAVRAQMPEKLVLGTTGSRITFNT